MGERNQKKEEESGSGWGSKLLLAAGAGALGFLASQLYSDYQAQSTSQGFGPGGGGSGGSSNSQRSRWEDIEGNNSTRKRKENRDKACDANIPEEMKCVACLANPKEMVLLPCKHVCLCEDCVDKVENCPICREYIQKKEPIFLS